MVGGLNKTGPSVVMWRQVRHTYAGANVAFSGFTIIEVMIVLIVTGALFVSAAILISGRQNQTAFDQAIHQIQADIQQTINEVAVGYFPDTDFSCVATAGGPSLGSGGSGQGTNSGCVFLGKAMQFKVHSTDPEQYAVHSIAGLQLTGKKEVQNLSQAIPRAVTRDTAHLATPGYPDITVISKLQSGLTTNSNSPPVKGMWFNNGGPDITIGEVAFINSLASYDVGGGVKSGTQQVVVYPVHGSALDETPAQGADAINSAPFRNAAQSPPDPSKGVFICFASGGTNQSGRIQIGGGNRSLTVTLKIYKGNTTCS